MATTTYGGQDTRRPFATYDDALAAERRQETDWGVATGIICRDGVWMLYRDMGGAR